MELELKPSRKNDYPITGFFLQGPSLHAWLLELERLHISIETLDIYALPNTTANSIWGCYIEFKSHKTPKDIGINEYATCLHQFLVVPQASQVFPRATALELDTLLKGKKTVLHPHIGFFELENPLQLKNHIELPTALVPSIAIPEDPVFIPKQVYSFQLKPVSPEEALDNMTKEHFPDKEQHKEKPLSSFEKLRLKVYKALFLPKEKKRESSEGENKGLGNLGLIDAGKESRFSSWLRRVFGRVLTPLVDKVNEDFENLEERNKKEVDKLLKMLKEDLFEALKYAVPLDEYGTSRGGEETAFKLGERWSDLSLGSQSAGGRVGGSVNLGTHYYTLKQQYEAAAQKLIERKEYQKAAFVYMRLLKDYGKAAQVLEDGGLYAEAASIYLTHLSMKKKAAECYEKAMMIEQAIDLYKELNELEKAGDLHLEINQKKEAFTLFEQLAQNFISEERYVKAARVFKEKMEDKSRCQQYLLKGWREQCNANQCLDFYFSNIEQSKTLQQAVEQVYKEDVDDENRRDFLDVLSKRYSSSGKAQSTMKNIAYEIVAQEAVKDHRIVSELIAFNRADKEFKKDTLRYKLRTKK